MIDLPEELALNRLVPCLLLLIALPVNAQTTVEIVIDASAAMWDRLGEDNLRITAARIALLDTISAIPGADIHVGLRVFGSRSSLGDTAACDDTRLLVAPDGFDPQALRHAVTDLMPGGGAPLIRALHEAVHDLAGASGDRLLVLVTAGDDSCHDSPARVVAALTDEERPIELRIVGLALSAAALKKFTGFTATRNTWSAAELAAAVRWSLGDILPAEGRLHPIRVELERTGQPDIDAEVVLDGTATGTSYPLHRADDGFIGDAPAGLYTATVTSCDNTEHRFVGIAVSAHGDAQYTLDVDQGPPPATLEVTPEGATAGGPLHVQYWGAPADGSWLTIVPADAPPGAFADRAPVSGPVGEVRVRAPDRPLDLEVRLHQDRPEGGGRLLNRLPFLARRAIPALQAAAEVEVGTPLEIEWRGAGHPGDHVVLVHKGAPQADHIACISASSDSPVTLIAPPDPGIYEVRYHSGLSGRILSRTPIEVFDPPAKIFGPQEIAAGSPFAVAWEGPDLPTDILTLVPAGTADDEYETWAYTSSGNPLTMQAPSDPGSYELRYVSGEDGTTLARQETAVLGFETTVTAPPRARAGSRFDVEWTGPDRTGDLIAIAEAGAPDRRHIDWAYTSQGSPLSLAAPERPGQYEVRYVTADLRDVLARSPITVE